MLNKRLHVILLGIDSGSIGEGGGGCPHPHFLSQQILIVSNADLVDADIFDDKQIRIIFED